MKSDQELYDERLIRFKKAIALEKPDKTPMQFNGDAFCAFHQGVKLSEIAVNAEFSITTILNSVKELGDIDVVDIGATYAPMIGTYNLAKTKVPGRELPENMLWQVDETGAMTEADYDFIIDKGFPAFFDDFVANRLKLDMEEFGAQMGKMAEAPQRYKDAGFVNSGTVMAAGEVDFLSGGRTMAKFTRDLFRMPDKVSAVLDIIHEWNINGLKEMLSYGGAVTAFCGAGRGACDLYSPKMWEKIVWKYYKGVAETVIEGGVSPQWHCDGDWERGLSYFRELEKGKCLFLPDGLTNIYKIKAVLGDRMCIRGDVPAALLVLGTPDDVYAYASKLVKDMGDGFVMGVGCMTPANAKVENVKAMIAAASGR